MPSSRRFFMIAAASLALSGCTEAAAVITEPILTNGLSATINGELWKADSTLVGANIVVPGEYQFRAVTASSKYALNFNLSGIGGPGTYALGTDGSIGGGYITVQDLTASKFWDTPGSGAAGTLTITEVNSTRIVGTFAFVATPFGPSGGTGTINVTGGSFNVPIRNGSAFAPLPGNAVSKIHTKILGADFTPSSLQGYLSSSLPGNFGIAGGSTNHYFTLFLADITGPGTYQLSQSSLRWMHVGVSATGNGSLTQEWIGFAAGNTGSVTITSITSTRVVGTFTATIQPKAGSSAAPLTISGDFDVGRVMKSFP